MKQPLILVPGLLCDAALWRPVIDGVSDVAACVVADVMQDDNFEGMAERILAWAGPRFALAGLSMGGYVAQTIMRMAPERVSRLALLDTNARQDTDEARARRRGLIELAQKGQFKGVTPRLLPLFLHPDRLRDAPLVAAVSGMVERVGKDAFVRQQTAIMNRPDGVPHLPKIRCPTLVLCGRQDVLTPLALHEEIAGAVPGARLVVIEDCGHLPPMERPAEAVAAMRDWLAA